MDKSQSRKIIGGKFGLPTSFSAKQSIPIFLEDNPLLLFNARSGIKLIVDQLKPDNVWLPSYLCPTIISAIYAENIKMIFYPINSGLGVTSYDFIDEIKPNDLVLIIDYFGFPMEKSIIEMIRSKGCKVIRDCSQALFFDWRQDSCDFHLYSPRKFLGVPDGGVLHTNSSEIYKPVDLTPPDSEIMFILFQALVLRREFDLYGGDRKWNELFHRAESLFKTDYSAMSELTKMILDYAIDYSQVMSQRKSNYRVLRSSLADIAIFPELSEDVTPLGFPIKVKQREAIQKKLFDNRVYPPIHWDISQDIPSSFVESHKLSQSILTIPCDQRYNEQDMETIALLLKQCAGL